MTTERAKALDNARLMREASPEAQKAWRDARAKIYDLEDNLAEAREALTRAWDAIVDESARRDAALPLVEVVEAPVDPGRPTT